MAERRGSRRQKSFLRGFVYFDKRRGVMSCLVRDVSERGARIIFSRAVAIPDSINLHIPQKEQTLRARVQWRRGDEIGLAFLGAGEEVEASADTAELTKRVTQLEAEIVALRRIIKQLNSEHPSGGEVEAA